MADIPFPRAIEFMRRGYSVAQMSEIKEHWDRLSDEEIARLGFCKQDRSEWLKERLRRPPPELKIAE
jgi:hypothetical protein